MREYFALVVKVIVVLLVGAFLYGYCARQFLVQSERVFELPLGSGLPVLIQLPSDSLATGSSASVPSENDSSGDSAVSVPFGENVQSGSQISVEYVGQEHSSQTVSGVRLCVYGSDPSNGQVEVLRVIDWCAFGSLAPGQSVNSSQVFLRNEGKVPVALSLSAADWVFKNSSGFALSQSYRQYFSLGWNYDGSLIGVGEVRAVTFTLSISSRIVDVATFSFRLVVTGTY